MYLKLSDNYSAYLGKCIKYIVVWMNSRMNPAGLGGTNTAVVGVEYCSVHMVISEEVCDPVYV